MYMHFVVTSLQGWHASGPHALGCNHGARILLQVGHVVRMLQLLLQPSPAPYNVMLRLCLAYAVLRTAVCLKSIPWQVAVAHIGMILHHAEK
jgi:hypothetical protein